MTQRRRQMNKIAVSDHFKEIYEDYYEGGNYEWRRLGALGKAENIVSLCKSLPHNYILEIGAGDGAILKRLSELNFGKELYAIEISTSGIEAIMKNYIPCLIESRLFDGYIVPYDDDRFDIAILSHVIEHVEHPRQLIYEASRVAKYVFVEVPLEDTMRMKNNFVFDKVGHINSYSSKTIRRFLQSCNLKLLGEKVTNPSIHKKGLLIYYVKQFMLQFSPYLATSLFTYHASLICEKDIG